MADNTQLGTGTGGDLISTDDLGSVKVQRVKVQYGVDGSATDVSDTNPLPIDDAGGSITVDGTVTAELSATDNAVLDAIQAAVETIDNAISGSEMQVDIVASAVLPVSDNGGSLTVDGTVTANAGTGPWPVTDNGGSLTVDGTVAATQSGTWNIGTVTPGTAATNLGKAEDAAHSSGDTGVMALAVRRDADTTLAGTDGDYAPLQVNASGSLKVAITAGAGSGGTSIADGASFTRDTTSVTPVGAVVEASAPTLTAGDAAGLSMTTAGALRVDLVSGGVSGIAEDAASAGGEEGVAMLAVRRDSASSGVSADGDFAFLSVTSDGSLRVSGSSGTTQYAEDAAHTTGDQLCVVGAVRRDTAAVGSGTDGDYSTLNVNSSGRLYTSTTIDAALPAGSNTIGALTANQSVNVAQMNGVATTMGNGASGTGVQRVTIASDSTGVLATVSTVTTVGTVTNITNQGQLADDAAFTVGTTRVNVAGFLADETATDSVDEGDAGSARMTLDRKQIVTEYVHAAAGGSALYTFLSTAAVQAAQIKGSAGKVYSLTFFNNGAAEVFVRLYNQTGAPASTDTANIVWRGMIPGDAAGAGFTIQLKGVQFSTGIGIRVTGAVADNDTTVLAANEVIGNVEYV